MASVGELGIGVVGGGVLGKAHATAYRKIPYIYARPHVVPCLVTVAGHNAGDAARDAVRYGYGSHTADWRTLVDNPRIAVFDDAISEAGHVE